MSYSVFDFFETQPFLLAALGDKSLRKGLKSKAAKFIGCHTTLISQLLHGRVGLNLEQADKLNQFFGHNEEESHFFLLLAQKERAGTESLRGYFQKQIDQILKSRQVIKKRVGTTETVAAQDELRYYSEWQYAAVHVALSIPEMGDAETMSQRLQIPLARVRAILDFLLASGLAVPTKEFGSYAIGPKHIHLGIDSPQLRNHHINWRVCAIRSIDWDIGQKNGFHYSSAVSISRADVPKLKEILIEGLKGMNNVIKASKEEEIFGLNFDFFNLKQVV